MVKHRIGIKSKKRLRNLVQYQDMSEDEFDDAIEQRELELQNDPELLEQRVQEKMEQFANDYDMEDMKSNDMLQLRSLAQALVNLEDTEIDAWRLRGAEEDDYTLAKLEKINKILQILRSDISKISNDLQLTRKIRKQNAETSVLDTLTDLKNKAMKFYRQKMLYIFCPECKYLLFTCWCLYSEGNNQVTLECKHCGHTFTEKLSPLYERDNKNLEDISLP